MLDHSIVLSLAQELEEAERSKVQLQHFSIRHPGMTIQDGYAIQREWMRLKFAQGRRQIGRKIGLTSRAMQRAVNITEPDYGLLLDDMLFEEGRDVPYDRFIEPRVEVELAFILSRRLEGNVSLPEVLSAIDYIVPAIEIIDARICRVDPVSKCMRSVVDTISDNAANAGLVLGATPVKADGIDMRWIGAILHRNDVIEDTGLAAAVLNHPGNGVAWLAERISNYGEALEPGEIILAGSFTSPIFASRGDSFYIDFGKLGSISIRFR